MRSVNMFRFGLTILMIFVMSMPAMAQERSSAMTPPQIVTLETVKLSPELQEKFSEQTVVVKLKATISASGTVAGQIAVISGSGDDALDQAAIAALQQSVFRPAYAGEEAVACTVVMPLHIKVEKYLPEEPVQAPEQQ